MKPALPITLRVKVTPRSAMSEIVGELADGTVKARIAAPPEHGKANQALIGLLAEHYGVSRSAITIVSGHAASLKLVRIAAL
jgi:uncharacterized protein (TIGR00251 family)